MKPTLIKIIIAMAFFALAIYAFQLFSENKANKEALESLKTEKEKEIQLLLIKNDSIANVAKAHKEAASLEFEEATALESKKKQLKNKAYETAPYTINSADSLYKLISRRFNQR